MVSGMEIRPTHIANTTPVGKPIPTGKVIYDITCGVESCNEQIPVYAAAAKTLGWTLKVLQTDGSSQQIANAWQQILRAKPNGVLIAGQPIAEVESYVKQAAAEGIATVDFGETSNIAGTGLVANVSGSVALTNTGDVYANWVVADAAHSGITNPAVVALNIPEFPSNVVITDSFKAQLAKLCPSCSYGEIDLGIAQLANAPTEVISYVRSHPSTKYILLSTDSAYQGVAAAVKTAGLGVKVFGDAPTSADLTAIKTGLEAGGIMVDFKEDNYQEMDDLARYFAGVPQVSIENKLSTWIVTAQTVPTTSSGLAPVITNVGAQYAKLWGKS